jgi:tripartite ATP-independent transporter DctM subunit
MSPEILLLAMVLGFFALLAVGVHLAWAMLSLGLVFGYLSFGPAIFPLTMHRFTDVMGSFSLIAIPLFVFMANMLSVSGIADELYETTYRWLGSLRGGLAMASVAACTVLAAMVGTGGAGITIMGLIALPAMLQRGYNRHLALGSIIAGGALGLMIPPSIMFILYGMFSGQSIGALFMGGIGPGLLLALLYVAYIAARGLINPNVAPPRPQEHKDTFFQKLAMLKTLLLPILLVLAVLGSIYLGIATVGEAAGVGAAGSIVAAAVRRRLTWPNLMKALLGTMSTVGVVMWITFGAFVYVGVITRAGGGRVIAQALADLPFGRWGVLIVIMIILLLLGMVIDVIGLVVLTVPIFVPVIEALGFHPLWFGVLFNMNLQIAFLSPPFGYGMFYLKSVAPRDVTTADLYRSVWPFILLQVAALGLVMVVPEVVFWIPRRMGG